MSDLWNTYKYIISFLFSFIIDEFAILNIDFCILKLLIYI